jgi:hypothetical protein
MNCFEDEQNVKRQKDQEFNKCVGYAYGRPSVRRGVVNAVSSTRCSQVTRVIRDTRDGQGKEITRSSKSISRDVSDPFLKAWHGLDGKPRHTRIRIPTRQVVDKDNASKVEPVRTRGDVGLLP